MEILAKFLKVLDNELSRYELVYGSGGLSMGDARKLHVLSQIYAALKDGKDAPEADKEITEAPTNDILKAIREIATKSNK